MTWCTVHSLSLLSEVIMMLIFCILGGRGAEKTNGVLCKGSGKGKSLSCSSTFFKKESVHSSWGRCLVAVDLKRLTTSANSRSERIIQVLRGRSVTADVLWFAIEAVYKSLIVNAHAYRWAHYALEKRWTENVTVWQHHTFVHNVTVIPANLSAASMR